ncbi:MAG: hypothetical protein P8Y03_15385 [Anaerolineales bacterium]
MITRHTPTLTAHFRLAFSDPVTRLSGEPAADRSIRWISLSLQEVGEGDILVLPAPEASQENLAEARRKGAAGVLLLGQASLPEEALPPGLPVAIAPAEHDPRETQRLLLTILINQRAALHERAARVHAQLSQLEAEGKGLDGLARAMADVSGEGVLVQDKRGRLLAEHPSSALVTIWEDVVKQLDSLSSLPASLLDRKKAGSQPAVVTQEIPGGLARLVIPITVGEVARGYLSLVGVAGELDVLDHLVAEQGALRRPPAAAWRPSSTGRSAGWV